MTPSHHVPPGDLSAAIAAALQQPAAMAAIVGALMPAVQAHLGVTKKKAPAAPARAAPAPTAATTPPAKSGGGNSELLAIIRELRGTIAELRAEVAALRGGAPHAAAPQPVAAANASSGAVAGSQPQPAMNYAAALGRQQKKGGAVSKPRVQVSSSLTAVPPLQPAVAPTAAIVSEISATSVLPARQYPAPCRELLKVPQIACGKRPADWAVAAKEEAHKHVLLVGVGAVEALSIAAEAMATHKQVASVSALILAPVGARADVTVAGVLATLGTSRQALSVEGSALDIQVRTERLECVPVDATAQTTTWSQGHAVLLRWHSARTEPGQDREPPKRDKVGQPTTASRLVCILQPQVLRQGEAGQNRDKARSWAKARCWDALRPLLGCWEAARPPMDVTRSGDDYLVTVVLMAPMVRAAMEASGQEEGVYFRPYLTKGEPTPPELEATILTVQLPEQSVRPAREHWTLLRAVPVPGFAGLLPQERPAKLRFRVWGSSPPSPELANVLASALGAPAPELPTTQVRVRGYPAWLGLASQQQPAVQWEADALFGAGAVRVLRCRHLTASGLRRPVFDLDVAGLPPTWEGAIAPGGDTRDEPRQWQRCRRQSTRRPVERVGPRALLPAVQGCQQAPAAGAMDEDVIADDDDDVVDPELL